ncbi:MAG: arginase family protein [Bacteroidota bacterium]
MDFTNLFFPPSSLAIPHYTARRLTDSIALHGESFPAWENAEVVLIGLPADPTQETYESANAIRAHLHGLSSPHLHLNIADLGNLTPQNTEEAFQESLADVVQQIKQKEILPLFFGGPSRSSYGQFLGHMGYTGRLEYVHIGSQLQTEDSSHLSNATYNRKILSYSPSPLFQFTHLGYQQYFTSQEELNWLSNRYQTAIRYGLLQADLTEAEPFLRDAHMASMDFSSIRASDAPGSYLPSPGGFTAGEACRLARYVGLSHTLASANIVGYQLQTDPQGQGALLVAMLLWYILQGRYQRASYPPPQKRSQLRRYNVQLHAGIETINFFLHLNTDRWWMEVPYQADLGKKKPRTLLVPCSVKDYEIAKNDQIPEKWWTIYNKLS